MQGPNVNFQLESPEEYWRRQEVITQDLDKQLREQKERDIMMKVELDAIKDRNYSGTHGSGLPKTAMKLPTTSPPKFAGEALNYLPWKKLWLETMGIGYPDATQLMQLKTSIDPRTADLVGLINITSMQDFWSLMDEEFLNYNALARYAIKDIKSLDREDPRFLQIMKMRITTHHNNLKVQNMEHRITSDEMIMENWLPMMTEMAREDWLKIPNRKSPLWPQFEQFLHLQAQASRERERLGLSQPRVHSKGKPCSKCKSKFHQTSDCKAEFCRDCKAWGTCTNKAHSRKTDKVPSGDTFCKGCNEAHPWKEHTIKWELSKIGQKSYMQVLAACM